jgi:putative membrane protein
MSRRTTLLSLSAALIAIGAAGTTLAHDTSHQAAAGAASSTGPGEARAVSHGDRVFANAAAEAGMEEVATGKLAEYDAAHAQVRQFATRMVADHANDKLRQIAGRDGITLPAQMDADAQHHMGRLETARGKDFDALYMQHQASDHRQVIDEFQKEADHGRNPDLRRFAADTLPTLREHLRLAEAAENALPASERTTQRNEAGMKAARDATGASSVAAEKSARMPVPKTGM